MTELFTETERRRLAGAATTLHERLSNPEMVGTADRPQSEVDELFELWREQFPNDEQFWKRLKAANVTAAECRAAMASTSLPPGSTIPEWVDRIESLIRAVANGNAADYPQKLDPEWEEEEEGDEFEGVPFIELSAAIATHISNNISYDPVRNVLSDQAMRSMRWWLQTRIQNRLTRILYVEFKSFVASQDSELAHIGPESVS